MMDSTLPLLEDPMSNRSNIALSLLDRAKATPERDAFSISEDGERFDKGFSYQRLAESAQRIAAALAQRGRRGDRVLLLFATGDGFLEALYGCMLSARVAIPLPLPRQEKHFQTVSTIVRDASAECIVTSRALRELISGFAPSCDVLALEDLAEAELAAVPPADLRPDDLAFIQYTSGSTSAPKGVMISHGRLIANLEGLRHAMDLNEHSRVLSWLPHFHDMGLISAFFLPVYLGYTCWLMPPALFLQRPSRWLQAISRHRATHSGGPNFAFAVTLKKFQPEENAGLDLSSWRVAFVGSDPLSFETLSEFARAFAPYGLRQKSLYPCYGMAEATLAVTGSRVDEGFATLRIDRDALHEGRVVPADASTPRAQTLVSSGVALPLMQVAITDPETGTPSPVDRVGEIWVKGPSVSAGYWGNDDATAANFGATLSGVEGFLRTGDLGFIKEDELYVTGRMKDLLKIRGKNHYPQDIEKTCQGATEVARIGCGIAFVLGEEAEGKVAVAFECDPRFLGADERVYKDAIRAMRAAVSLEHGLSLAKAIFLQPGSIPKTSSGKLKRRELMATYAESKLHALFEG
jgi:acyl-CoA synthetase (AMP-forming)/AMP-acid ligase II